MILSYTNDERSLSYLTKQHLPTCAVVDKFLHFRQNILKPFNSFGLTIYIHRTFILNKVDFMSFITFANIFFISGNQRQTFQIFVKLSQSNSSSFDMKCRVLSKSLPPEVDFFENVCLVLIKWHLPFSNFLCRQHIRPFLKLQCIVM